MSYTPKPPYKPEPTQAASLRPSRLFKKARIALAAIVDAEWLTARYPRYALAPISLATTPTRHSALSGRPAHRPGVWEAK